MHYKPKVLWNLAGGGGGGTIEHPLDYNILPEGIRADPSITKFKSIPALAEGFTPHLVALMLLTSILYPTFRWMRPRNLMQNGSRPSRKSCLILE
jgi:hypothetical protein